MFYAHFVLSKKGPLARIWLAAHWDKKLTKAHVFETNVPSCVDSIIHPKIKIPTLKQIQTYSIPTQTLSNTVVKLALRTSGHLLLGVVRIHSRKAKYLLADCNEAFVKIKMAFRPGVVDLPEENREAAFAAITLPEVFHDFDTSMPDFNDAEVQKQFTLNQSRVEDITMKEDLVNINLAQEDGFGDLGFDEREILRDAPSANDSVYKRSSDDSSMLADVSKQKDPTIDTSLEKPIEIGLEDQFRNDGFGGDMGMGDGILGEEFMNAGGNLFEEQPEIQEPPEIQGGEVHLSQPEPSPEPEIPPEKDETKEQEVAQQAVTQETEKEPDQTAGETTTTEQPTAVTDQTTLVQNEDVEFALEPIVEGAGHKERQRRKRKLIVDDIKELAGDLIKSQLKDTSDIVTSLDLAPPTKKLMLWKETGGAEKLFNLPGRLHSSKRILHLFVENLQTDIPREPKRQRREPKQDEPEVQRDAEPIAMPDISTIVQMSTSNIQLDEPVQPVQRPEDIPSTSQEEDPAPPPPPQQDFSLMSTRRGSVSSSDGGYDDDNDLWGGAYDEDDDDHVPSVRPPPVEEDMDDPSNVFSKDDEEEDVAAEEGEDEAKHHERVLNKRAHSMLMGINKLLQNSESVSFGEITRKLYRKQVASKFYSLLVLKKQQAIDLSQEESFSDIRISRGIMLAEMI